MEPQVFKIISISRTFFLVHLLNTENNVVAFCKKKYVHYIRTDILHRVQPTHTLQKYELHAWGNVPMNCFKIHHTTFKRIRKPVRSFLCFYSFHQACISHFWRVIRHLSILTKCKEEEAILRIHFALIEQQYYFMHYSPIRGK